MEKPRLPNGETLDELFARLKVEAAQRHAASFDRSSPDADYRLNCERCGETYRRSNIDDCERCARPVCYHCGHWVTVADGAQHWKCGICVTMEEGDPPPAT